MIGGNRECGCRLFAAGVKKARLASLSDLKGNLFCLSRPKTSARVCILYINDAPALV